MAGALPFVPVPDISNWPSIIEKSARRSLPAGVRIKTVGIGVPANSDRYVSTRLFCADLMLVTTTSGWLAVFTVPRIVSPALVSGKQIRCGSKG